MDCGVWKIGERGEYTCVTGRLINQFYVGQSVLRYTVSTSVSGDRLPRAKNVGRQLGVGAGKAGQLGRCFSFSYLGWVVSGADQPALSKH